jgi:hypothetical protein
MPKVKFLELPRTVPPCSDLKFLELPPTVPPCPCVNSTLPTSYNRPWIPPRLRDHNRPLKKSNFFPPLCPGLQLSYTLCHSGAHRPHNRYPGRHDRKPVPKNSRSRKLSPPRFQQIRGLGIRLLLDSKESEVSKSVASRFQQIGSLELGCSSISTNSRSRNLLLLDSSSNCRSGGFPRDTLSPPSRRPWLSRNGQIELCAIARAACIKKPLRPWAHHFVSLSRSRPAAAVLFLDFWNSVGDSALESLPRAIRFRNSGVFEKSRVWSLWG